MHTCRSSLWEVIIFETPQLFLFLVACSRAPGSASRGLIFSLSHPTASIPCPTRPQRSSAAPSSARTPLHPYPALALLSSSLARGALACHPGCTQLPFPRAPSPPTHFSSGRGPQLPSANPRPAAYWAPLFPFLSSAQPFPPKGSPLFLSNSRGPASCPSRIPITSLPTAVSRGLETQPQMPPLSVLALWEQ